MKIIRLAIFSLNEEQLSNFSETIETSNIKEENKNHLKKTCLKALTNLKVKSENTFVSKSKYDEIDSDQESC